MGRILAVFGLITLLLTAFTPQAGAHGVSDTADFHLAQSFAGNELTLVVRRTQELPSPLVIDFIAHDPVRPVNIAVGLAGTTQRARLSVDRRGTHTVRLSVDRAGPWELSLDASGEQARIPFRVRVSRLSAWEPVAYGGLAATGLFIGIALVSAFVARRRIFVAVPAAAGVIALTVGITAALLSSSIPPAPAEGAIPVDPSGGRPYVNHTVSTDSDPVTGREFVVRLSLTDGNTGRAVDDLVAHHDALAHMVVSSVDGQFFRHLHPIRTEPGELAVRLTADRPGRYLVHAEFERVNSGSQLATGSFVVTGPDTGAFVAPADVRQAVAGRSLTIGISVGGKADLQAWLGMAGHLVVRDEAGGFFGHVHEMDSMTAVRPVADETVATHDPDLRFTFTFPRSGRYFGWVQYQRNFTVTTVPIRIDVQ